MSLFDTLKADAARYEPSGGWARNLGFWIGATQRVGAVAHQIESPVVRVAALIGYKLAHAPLRLLRNVDIPARTKIGKGLCLVHPHGMLLPEGIEIGDHCLIFHDVTLGFGPIPGIPKIGHNVTIYAGAKILGGITIGDNSEIGANCVVTRDVPPGSVVAMPPMRVIPRATIDKMRTGAGRPMHETREDS